MRHNKSLDTSGIRSSLSDNLPIIPLCPAASTQSLAAKASRPLDLKDGAKWQKELKLTTPLRPRVCRKHASLGRLDGTLQRSAATKKGAHPALPRTRVIPSER